MSRLAFVTRHVTSTWPLFARLKDAGYTVQGHSLLRFEPVEHQELPEATDWVFAYSGNGVRMLAAHIVEQIRDHDIPVAAMGHGTAAAWEARGLTPRFVGRGAPSDVVAGFAERLGPIPDTLMPNGWQKVVVFVQARASQESIANALDARAVTVPLVTYENLIDEDVIVPPADLLYLTSPLNAEAALRHLSAASAPEIWCIGPTTAAAVRTLGFDVARVVGPHE